MNIKYIIIIIIIIIFWTNMVLKCNGKIEYGNLPADIFLILKFKVLLT